MKTHSTLCYSEYIYFIFIYNMFAIYDIDFNNSYSDRLMGKYCFLTAAYHIWSQMGVE